ncbi:MAG TPA: PKD domain-containing protein [Kofleriaceae bacterium]|jgi:PKD repeat protein
MVSSRWSVVPALVLLACSSGPPPSDAHRSSIEQADTTATTAAVLTQHNDIGRTGRQLHETTLTPDVVLHDFGRLYNLTVDERVFSQPLFVPNKTVTKSGGGTITTDVVYVATEGNTIYAFDAKNYNGGAPLWSRNFGSAVPSSDLMPDSTCTPIPRAVGITGTPVIDPTMSTMYFVAATKNPQTGVYAQTLHAIDIATGNDIAGTASVAISATAPVNTGGTQVNRTFNAETANQRAALLLVGNQLWIAWASYCSNALYGNVYSGWVMQFDATNLATAAHIVNTGPLDDVSHPAMASPIHGGAGVWMGASGPVSDGTKVWVDTGNGWLDIAHQQWSDSVLQLAPDSSHATLDVLDYFTPWNADYSGVPFSETYDLYFFDEDMSSTGLLLLPPSEFPSQPHMLVGGNKRGAIYLLDADALGHHATTGLADPICTGTPNGACVLASTKPMIGGIPNTYQYAVSNDYGVPAYFNGALYYAGNVDSLKRVALAQTTPVLASPAPAATSYPHTFGYPGATPSISASNATDGDAIVWTLDHNEVTNFYALYADRAASASAATLYDSSMAAGGDGPAQPTRFQTPTIAGGHVFVGGTTGDTANTNNGRITVYGQMFTAPATLQIAAGNPVTATLFSDTHDADAANTARTTTYSATVSAAGPTVTFGTNGVAAGQPVIATISTTGAAVGTYTISWSAAVTSPSSGTTTYTGSTTLTIVTGPPSAAFAWSCNGWQCGFDASASTGANLTYAWTFGNGATGTAGPAASMHYHGNNTYLVTLTVTNAGGSATAQHPVTVNDPPPNAVFTYSCNGRACNFDGTGSTDTPGWITQLSWVFDEPQVASGGLVSHTFGIDGYYVVQLTAIDNEGQVGQVTHTVAAFDARPVAVLSVGCVHRLCTANASGSSDDLGIARSTIDWGDGATVNGAGVPAAAQHTYAADGTFVVWLTVVDTAGQATATHQSVTESWVLAAHYTQRGFVYATKDYLEEDASATSGPSPISFYHWVWSDGTVDDTMVPADSHWSTTGDPPTLTVTDVAGHTSTATAPDTSTWTSEGGQISLPVGPGDPGDPISTE